MLIGMKRAKFAEPCLAESGLIGFWANQQERLNQGIHCDDYFAKSFLLPRIQTRCWYCEDTKTSESCVSIWNISIYWNNARWIGYLWVYNCYRNKVSLMVEWIVRHFEEWRSVINWSAISCSVVDIFTKPSNFATPGLFAPEILGKRKVMLDSFRETIKRYQSQNLLPIIDVELHWDSTLKPEVAEKNAF